jgi:hypothetical protein
MSTHFIGITFPESWHWTLYEKNCIDSIVKQIDNNFTNQKNLVINLTWFGPQFSNGQWRKYCKFVGQKFDNLFLITTVDPAMINADQIDEMVCNLGHPKLFRIGNFDSEHHFNFFAPILANNFRSYQDQELELIEPTYLFINYNRKPRQHRVNFVKKLIDCDLKKYGIVTLGKPDRLYDKDETNNLFFPINEEPADYIKYGHWYPTNVADQFGIPHDVLSLHNMHYWQHHFLYIIGATEFNVWDDIFVSETQFKPILGLRPFLINGNIRTYQWLRDNDFRTFNHYFDNINFEDPETVHESLCRAIEFLLAKSSSQLLDLYNQMLPDLYHNRERFYKYADEQQYKIDHIFEVTHV